MRALALLVLAQAFIGPIIKPGGVTVTSRPTPNTATAGGLLWDLDGGQLIYNDGTAWLPVDSPQDAGKVAEAYMADASITAEQLATDPTACTAGQFVTDLAANGTLTCAVPPGGGSGLTYAETAWSSLGGF